MKIKKSNNYILLNNIQPFDINKEKKVIIVKDFKLKKNNDIVTLYDNFNNEHTSYNINTYQNFFSYIINFFKYVKFYNILREEVLILGFGIGGIPLKLSLDNKVKKIDVIDLNYDLFRIFKTIIKNPSNKINFIYNDVNNFFKTSTNKYNIIFDDIFSGDVEKVILNYDLIYNNLYNNGYLFINIHTNKQLEIIKDKLKKFKILEILRDNEILLICKKNITYYDKYVKYKNKYLQLKSIIF